VEEAIQLAMDMEVWQMSEQRKGVRFRGVKEETGEDSPLNNMMERMDSLLELMKKRASYSNDKKKRDFKRYSCGK
jgi:hypothetical protein